ncbi:MAG: hypothetical protein ACLPYS_17900 [Vulcanimicrobiaceae bacterium]
MIAFAILIGGRSLLVEIAQFHAIAFVALLVIGAALLRNLGRNMAPRTSLGRFRASRDVAFLAALISALAFVFSPARWSLGACIAALEFALILELLAKLAPEPSPGASRPIER